MEEALARAERENRPIMIDVYADWCRWCKTLDDETYVHKDVIAKAEEFVLLKLDADVHRSIMSQYRIGGLPTILFIDADGREIHRIIGYKPPSDFVRDMDTALDAFRSGKGS
jgi:thiol:disulfide interchange protein